LQRRYPVGNFGQASGKKIADWKAALSIKKRIPANHHPTCWTQVK
jgi:hypothetical protein